MVQEHPPLNWQLIGAILGATAVGILLSYLILRFARKRKAILPSTSISLSNPEKLGSPSEDQKQADLKLPDLAAEIVRNRKIAAQQLNDKPSPFETRVWDACQYDIHKLPTKLQDQLKKVYDDIHLANSLTWLSTEWSKWSPIVLKQYTELQSAIAERLSKIRDL